MPFNPDRYPLPIPEENYYDKEEADRAVNFIQSLEQFKGSYAGEPLRLMRWQEDRIIRPLFGLKRPDGTRQYREALIFVPGKNGKSNLVAGIGLKLVYADDEPGAEVYGAATSRRQASIVFDVAKQMIRQNEWLNDKTKEYVREKKLLYEEQNSFYQAISRDAAGSEGYDAHGVIVDEVHRQPDRELIDVLETRQGARRQPLIVYITTAGEQKTGNIAGELVEYAKKVLSGEIDDPAFFCYLSSAEEILQDEDNSWTDRHVWYYANPALERPGVPETTTNGEGEDIPNPEAGFRKYDEFKRAIEKAQRVPAKRPGILRRYLNIWRSSEGGIVNEADWEKLRRDYEEGMFYGQPAWGGIDLSAKADLTAWVMVVPTGDAIAVIPRMWVPENKVYVRSKEDNIEYDVWVEDGWLLTSGYNSIDERDVEEQIKQDAEHFKMQTIGFDPWSASRMYDELVEYGLTMVEMRQGMRTMSPPTKELIEDLVPGEHIVHDGNPVLKWMLGNTVLREDQNENYMPAKKQSNDRIDGVVALIMAIDQWVRENEPDKESVYEKRGLRTV